MLDRADVGCLNCGYRTPPIDVGEKIKERVQSRSHRGGAVRGVPVDRKPVSEKPRPAYQRTWRCRQHRRGRCLTCGYRRTSKGYLTCSMCRQRSQRFKAVVNRQEA